MKNYPIPVSNGLFAHRKKMGAAVWVFMWLIDHTTKEVPATDGRVEGLVHGGQPVALSAIASDLGMSWDAIYEHLAQLAKAGYIRKIVHGTGRANGYAVVNSKRFSNRRTKAGRSERETSVQNQTGTPVQIARGTPVQNAIDLPAFVREPTDKSPSIDKEEVLQDITRQTTTANPDENPSLAARLLSEECGRFDLNFQRERTEQIKAEARKRGVSAKAVADLLIAQWREYKRAGPKLEFRVSSAEKFWTSGTWDDQANWPWKAEHRPQAANGRRYGGTDVNHGA